MHRVRLRNFGALNTCMPVHLVVYPPLNWDTTFKWYGFVVSYDDESATFLSSEWKVGGDMGWADIDMKTVWADTLEKVEVTIDLDMVVVRVLLVERLRETLESYPTDDSKGKDLLSMVLETLSLSDLRNVSSANRELFTRVVTVLEELSDKRRKPDG